MTRESSSAGRALALGCVVALALLAVPGALAAGGYGLDSPSAVDVPNGVVSGDGEFFTVSQIARVSRGDPFVVRTTAPAGAAYEVELRGMSGLVVDVSDRTLRGNDSTSFGTEHLEPGSYVAVLTRDGESKRVLPLVVEGYAVSADAPETVEAGADTTVEVTLEAEPSAPPVARVDLVVVDRASDTVVLERSVDAAGDGYATTVRLEDPGDYDLWVGVRGRRSVGGHEEVLGFGDAHRLSVTGSAASTGTGPTDSTDAATPTVTARATDVDGVITRNPTTGASTAVERQPTTLLSAVLALLLAGGLGFLYLTRT